MNERIRELAEQAMVFSSENGGWRISTHVPNDFQEKFAELIVQECLTEVENTVLLRDTNRYYPNSDSFNIKRHFGVEE
jgi:hypothetical protein